MYLDVVSKGGNGTLGVLDVMVNAVIQKFPQTYLPPNSHLASPRAQPRGDESRH